MRLFLIFIIIFSVNIYSKELKNDGLYRYIQVLAIRDFSRAKPLLEKLDLYDYKYILRDSVKKNEHYYRVVVGPFMTLEETKTEQKNLEKLLKLKSSFILTYKTEPSSNVNKVFTNNEDYKSRVDEIVKLSFTKDNFLKNKEFVCKELND